TRLEFATLLCSSSTTRLLILSLLLFTDTATPEIYTLSLHDALPISTKKPRAYQAALTAASAQATSAASMKTSGCCEVKVSPCMRSEEHTSELQSRENLVCRLLLEKKKKIQQ